MSIRGKRLGLFLGREVATRRGGHITVLAKAGLGGEFTLTLPLTKG